jgi:hypothetical protein
LLAALVGVFFLLRFCATAHADKLTFGKAILYGLLVLGLLAMNGFSLINKSRSGYVIVAIATLLPVFGLLAQSVHLVTLFITGDWATDKIGTLTCALSAGQLFATAVLFFFLLSRGVRSHVWKRAA